MLTSKVVIASYDIFFKRSGATKRPGIRRFNGMFYMYVLMHMNIIHTVTLVPYIRYL